MNKTESRDTSSSLSVSMGTGTVFHPPHSSWPLKTASERETPMPQSSIGLLSVLSVEEVRAMTEHIILERRMYCDRCKCVQPHVVSKYDEQDGFVDVLAVCERKFYETSKVRKTELCGHENFMKMKKSNWEALCQNDYL